MLFTASAIKGGCSFQRTGAFAHVVISAEKLSKCILSAQLPADQREKEQAFIFFYGTNLEQTSL